MAEQQRQKWNLKNTRNKLQLARQEKATIWVGGKRKKEKKKRAGQGVRAVLNVVAP